jgi:tRNA pseudouridine55 synthase
VSLVSGLAVVSKPAGVTSFTALSPIKRKLASTKVGHAGTLDKFATGLLVVLAGPVAHLTPWFSSLDKSYRAKLRFGFETGTLDPEGEVVAEAPLPSREALEAVLPLFRGPIMQKPPLYSALHVDGKRAYERALAGEKVEMEARPVTIHSLELLSYNGGEAELLVSCSSGTYIRSLARDIALAAGSRASLSALCRESIGPLGLADAVSPEDFDAARDLRAMSPELALALGLGLRRVAGDLERRFRNGGMISTRELGSPELAPPEGESAFFSASGAFLGVAFEGGRELAYRFVIGAAS